MVNPLDKVRTGYEASYASSNFAILMDDGRTHQSFKDECDVNTIVSRWLKSGQVPLSQLRDGQFLDVSNVPDYHTALNVVIDARERFSALPSDLRARFANDPGKFLAFVEDPKNVDELVSLGLASKKADKAPSGPHSAGDGALSAGGVATTQQPAAGVSMSSPAVGG